MSTSFMGWAPVLFLSWMSAGCGDEGLFSMELGTLYSGYEPLVDGDDCEIINGPQGGYWIMVGLELDGVTEDMRGECRTSHTQTGEQITRLSLTVHADFDEQRPLGAYMQIPEDEWPIESLTGDRAQVACDLGVAQVSANVELVMTQ